MEWNFDFFVYVMLIKLCYDIYRKPPPKKQICEVYLNVSKYFRTSKLEY